MRRIYRFIATSDHALAHWARRLHRAGRSFSMPAPRAVVRPALYGFLAARALYYFAVRVFVCEPLFKAYCTSYGRGLRTGVFVHYVEGVGDLVLGDDVLVDGKCAFLFASRYSERPTIAIGDRSGIGHQCVFRVGKRITIGRECRIASDVTIFDASGHPSDPEARRLGLPGDPDEVRPITIGDNVWIGVHSIIFPGVTIGDGSIVSAGSVVTGDVPPATVVAGNPARRIASLRAAEAPGSGTAPGERRAGRDAVGVVDENGGGSDHVR